MQVQHENLNLVAFLNQTFTMKFFTFTLFSPSLFVFFFRANATLGAIVLEHLSLEFGLLFCARVIKMQTAIWHFSFALLSA